MSQTIIAVILNLLSIVLPLLGVHLVSADLTTTVQTIVGVVTGVWIWYRRYKVGDVTIAGFHR